MFSPRLQAVTCSSPAGLHRMAYHEWGAPDNPDVVLCVHGLTRTGRDFDDLAMRLAKDFRVVCPDIVGRGLSDRLATPMFYAVPQYVADLVTLIARLQPTRLRWVGTSMGGLIGLGYAGAVAQSQFMHPLPTPAQAHRSLPHTGVRLDKLVLNDVGPHLEPVSIARIGQYISEDISFDTFDAAVAFVSKNSTSFGPHTEEQWRAFTRYTYIEQNGKWVKHYDLKLAVPFKSMDPQSAIAGEQLLWTAYDAIRAPILIVHGQESDLLSPQTVQQMLRRNQRARAVDFAGVGHAPTLMANDQIDVVAGFLYEP